MRSCKAWNIGRLLWLSGINDAYSMSSLNVSFPPLDPSVPFGPLPLQTEEDSFYQPFLKPETFHFVFFFSGPFLLPLMSFVFREVDLICCITSMNVLTCTRWSQCKRNPLCWVSNKLSNDDQHFFSPFNLSVFLCFSLMSHRTSVLRKQFSVISGSFLNSCWTLMIPW